MKKASRKKKIWFELNYKILLTGGIVFGLLIILLPHISPQPDYTELSETTITADRFLSWQHYRAGRSYSLITTDEVEYHIRGDFSISELKDALPPGTNADIKYYKGLYYFWPAYYIKELCVNGKVLVSYEDYQPGNELGCALAGTAVIAVSVLFWTVAANAEKEEAKRKALRQEKLKKKYGENYREPGERRKNHDTDKWTS